MRPEREIHGNAEVVPGVRAVLAALGVVQFVDGLWALFAPHSFDYATGMTRSPVAVSDVLFDRLREHFDKAQLVELTNIISLENYRARFNWALGIEGQGFSDGAFCVPPEVPRTVNDSA